MSTQPIEPAGHKARGLHVVEVNAGDRAAAVPEYCQPLGLADTIEGDPVSRLVASWPPLDPATIADLDAIING